MSPETQVLMTCGVKKARGVMDEKYPVSRGEPPLLQKGKGIILSQKSRKKVAKKSQLYSILLVKTEKR